MHGRYYRLFHRIRKDVAETVGYPYLPVPWNDGTLIDLDGNVILKEKPHVPKTQAEANARELSIKNSIRRNRRKNATAQTG